MDDLNALPKYLAHYKEHDIVLLSQKLYGPMRELRADVNQGGATFRRIREQKKPREFNLSDAEADGFCMAWLAFRASQYEAEQAEKRRQEEVKSQAYAIARDCPAIMITEQDKEMEVYDVQLAEIGFSYAGLAYGPDELLQKVEKAKEAYDYDRAIKANVEKALSIEAKIEGLIVKKDPTQACYHVTFHGSERKWITPEDLLKKVKEIVSAYLEDLLAKHEDIHVVKTEPGTADRKAVWTVSCDGVESVQCIGMAEVLRTVEQFIAQKQVTSS